MAFDWSEFLELARGLAGQAGRRYSAEASERSAVSRAYYAAFCWARNYAAKSSSFQHTHTARDHERLREHFKRRGEPQLASALNKLRGWRNECDYEDTVTNLHLCVKNAIRTADKVIKECL